MISYPIDKATEVLTEFTRYADKSQGGEIAEMLSPFFIVSKALFPHLTKISVNLLRLVHSGIENSYSKQNKQLVLQIFLLHRLLDTVKVASPEASLGHQKMMSISLHHRSLLHGLVGTAYPISIKVGVHIIHSLYVLDNTVNHKVVLIENMLWQRLGATAHKLGAECAGMNCQKLMHKEAPCISPGENSVGGQNALVADRTVANAVYMYVIIVGYGKVYTALPLAPFKVIEEAYEILAHSVVRVNHLEILTRSVNKALVDALAVTAILLVNHPDYVWIILCVAVCNLARRVL